MAASVASGQMFSATGAVSPGQISRRACVFASEMAFYLWTLQSVSARPRRIIDWGLSFIALPGNAVGDC